MSSDPSSSNRLDRIEARLDRLERLVNDLRGTVDAWPEADSGPETSSESDATPSPAGRPPTSPDHPPDAEAPSSPKSTESPTGNRPSDEGEASSPPRASAASPSPEVSGSSEFSFVHLRSEDWLNYVGIGLLLFGLAFLFKYSIEQGWLVPPVRVGFGVLTGSVLLGTGLRIYDERRRLRQILLGGSSATFYGTVFAAYQLYGLVSYPVAFGSMVAVTVVSIALALQQDHASMAVIGTIGGLGTPFLLYGDVGAVGGLSVYTSLVLVGACSVYLYRGWPSLLYSTVVGGWAVLLVPCADAALSGTRPDGAGVLQGGLILTWLLLGGTPVLRAVLRLQQPDRWPESPQTSVGKWHRKVFGDRPAYGLVTASPFVALFASRLLWTGSALLWAGVATVGVLVYAGAFLGLRRIPMPRYAPAHGLVATVLAAYGLSEALGGITLLLAWAVEAVLLLVLARRLDDVTLRSSGHVLFAIVGCWLGSRFATVEPSPRPLVSPAALSELVVLGLGAVALRWTRDSRLRRLYRGLLVVGWFGWWANELLPLPQGLTYLLLVGGLSSTGLLVLARRRDDLLFRVAGHTAFAGLAAALGGRWIELDPGTTPVLGLAPLTEMAVLGLGLTTSYWLQRATARRLYRGAGLTGWLAWWAHELIPLANGHAYVSLVWGLTAAALLTSGTWRRYRVAQKAGLVTLALFVGKLFLIDLATLSALWRIALFLGAGGGFLLVSYTLPGLGDADATDTSP